MLHASGDPAAASSSTIAELQNPEINPYLGHNLFVVCSDAFGRLSASSPSHAINSTNAASTTIMTNSSSSSASLKGSGKEKEKDRSESISPSSSNLQFHQLNALPLSMQRGGERGGGEKEREKEKSSDHVVSSALSPSSSSLSLSGLTGDVTQIVPRM
jgi:hypothetical protein